MTIGKQVEVVPMPPRGRRVFIHQGYITISAVEVTLPVSITAAVATVSTNISSVAAGVTFTVVTGVANLGVDVKAQSVGNITIAVAAWNVVGNINVDIAAQTVGNLGVDIKAQTVGNIGIKVEAWDVVGNIGVDIKAQTVGNIGIDIKAQTIGNLNVNIAAAAVAITVTGSVTITSGTINVQTSSGVYVNTGQAVYGSDTYTLSNNGGVVGGFFLYSSLSAIDQLAGLGKFFPHGCKGVIEKIYVYGDTSNAATTSRLFLGLSPYPGGEIEKQIVLSIVDSAPAWYSATVGFQWNHDSLFLSMDQIVCDATMNIGYDASTRYDLLQKTAGAFGNVWTQTNARLWLRVDMVAAIESPVAIAGFVDIKNIDYGGQIFSPQFAMNLFKDFGFKGVPQDSSSHPFWSVDGGTASFNNASGGHDADLMLNGSSSITYSFPNESSHTYASDKHYYTCTDRRGLRMLVKFPGAAFSMVVTFNYRDYALPFQTVIGSNTYKQYAIMEFVPDLGRPLKSVTISNAAANTVYLDLISFFGVASPATDVKPYNDWCTETATPLASGNTYTSAGRCCDDYRAFGVSCYADNVGTLIIQDSVDNSTYRNIKAITVNSNARVDRAYIPLRRWMRAYFSNSGNAQSNFDLRIALKG